MSLEVNTPIFFDNANTKIKNLIKNNGSEVCRNNFDKSYITYALNTFTHGYIFLGNKFSGGKSKKSSLDNYFVKGFIIFEYTDLNHV